MSEKSEAGDYTLLKYILIFNAVVGFCMLEYAWFKTRRFRRPNRDLDELYPAYRRTDALSWKKWKLYPGALLLLVPRLLATGILGLSLLIWLKLLLIGHKNDGTPIRGCRKAVFAFIFKIHFHLMSFLAVLNILRHEQITLEDVNHYEEYLGTV